MRVPGQVEVFRSPEGQSGGDSGGAAPVGGGGAASSSSGSAGATPSAPSGSPSTPSSTPVVPSSTPVTPVPTTPSDLGDQGDGTPSDVFDFAGLLNGQFADGEVTLPSPAPVVPPPAPAAPPPPVATPPAPAAAPVAQPVAPAAPSSQAPLSLAEPGQLAEAMALQQAAIVDEAARTVFGLSAEEVQGLEENAVATIPRLLARVFVESQRSMLMTLQKAIPAMLGPQLQQRQKHESNENAFYDKWKGAGIERGKHSAIVTRLATMYRQMNPQATFDQMMEDLGPAVIMAAKIQPPAPSPTAHRGNGIAVPPPSPFVPAGGGPGALSSQNQGDPWDILDPNRAE